MCSVKAAGSKSDRASKLRKLFDLLDICGISYERGRDNIKKNTTDCLLMYML